MKTEVSKTKVKKLMKAGYISKQGTDGRIVILTCIVSPIFKKLDEEIKWIENNYNELLRFSESVANITFAERKL